MAELVIDGVSRLSLALMENRHSDLALIGKWGFCFGVEWGSDLEMGVLFWEMKGLIFRGKYFITLMNLFFFFFFFGNDKISL